MSDAEPQSASVTRLDRAARDRTIESHLSFVRSQAARISRDLGGSADFDDLVAYGMTGLVEAADRFDPTRGIAFSTFSYYRIRGAIYDGLRKTGWLSRSQYARFRAASDEYLEDEQARSGNVSAHGAAGATTTNERADTLGRRLDNLATIFITSYGQDDAPELADVESPDAANRLETKQTNEVLRQALSTIDARERRLLELYYFKGLTLKAAGEALNLSKSWTSRLHTRAIESLGAALAPFEDLKTS